MNAEIRAEALFRRGVCLFEQGLFDTARVLLAESVRLRRDRAEPLLFLALAESKNPHFLKQAERHFLEAIELEPWNPDFRLALGRMYKREGLPIRAERLFRKAALLDPHHRTCAAELEALRVRSSLKSFWRGLKDRLQDSLRSQSLRFFRRPGGKNHPRRER